MSAPASAKSAMKSSGFSIIRWQSSGSFVIGRRALHHRRPEGDVGDEVAVHDVDVDDGAAAALGCRDFVGQMGEVGGQDGECQFDQWVRSCL